MPEPRNITRDRLRRLLFEEIRQIPFFRGVHSSDVKIIPLYRDKSRWRTEIIRTGVQEGELNLPAGAAAMRIVYAYKECYRLSQ